MAGALAAARIAVGVINPRQVREFARATGRLAKTDRLSMPNCLPVLARRLNLRFRPLEGRAGPGAGSAGDAAEPVGHHPEG